MKVQTQLALSAIVSALVPTSAAFPAPAQSSVRPIRSIETAAGGPSEDIQNPKRSLGGFSSSSIRYHVRQMTSVVSSGRSAKDDQDSDYVIKHEKQGASIRPKGKFALAARTPVLLGLWYFLSVFYNIFSKKALNVAPELAWTTAWFQMAGGLFYALPMWASGLRQKPELSTKDIQKLIPVAFLHSLVHVGGVVSMGAGAVSFTYIVKATEPAVSALLAAIVLKSYLPIPVYMSLIPVITGVSLASVSELSFTWKSFDYAMMSNVASASRGIVSKKTMNERLGKKHMNAMNLYAVLTILSTIMIFPIALVLEGNSWVSSFQRLDQTRQISPYILQTLLGALFYYTYNEASFMALNNISPVTHSLASSLRRVFIITSSMLVFGNKMTWMGIFGSCLSICGAVLYSWTKQRCLPKKSA